MTTMKTTPNNMDIFGRSIEVDDFYALLKKGNDEIVLQISLDGEVSLLSNLR